MATSNQTNHKTIERFYEQRALIKKFIANRVNNDDDVTDLMQEVFLRLLEYKEDIIPEGAKAMAFAIAANVVNDYLRRHYVRSAAEVEIASLAVTECNVTEEHVIGNDLLRLEKRHLDAMPAQRRMVYIMRLHERKTSKEIADELNLATRTVENHFYIGIRQMRTWFARAI